MRRDRSICDRVPSAQALCAAVLCVVLVWCVCATNRWSQLANRATLHTLTLRATSLARTALSLASRARGANNGESSSPYYCPMASAAATTSATDDAAAAAAARASSTRRAVATTATTIVSPLYGLVFPSWRSEGSKGSNRGRASRGHYSVDTSSIALPGRTHGTCSIVIIRRCRTCFRRRHHQRHGVQHGSHTRGLRCGGRRCAGLRGPQGPKRLTVVRCDPRAHLRHRQSELRARGASAAPRPRLLAEGDVPGRAAHAPPAPQNAIQCNEGRAQGSKDAPGALRDRIGDVLPPAAGMLNCSVCTSTLVTLSAIQCCILTYSVPYVLSHFTSVSGHVILLAP